MTNTRLSIPYMSPFMGCDPEFFFKSKGRVIGSEKLINSETGFTPKITGNHGAHTAAAGTVSKVIVDGVQAELNPRPNTCRANLANEIGAIFRGLHKTMEESGQGHIKMDFSQTVNISKTELSKLDEKNQKFGCSPSLNSYKDTGAKLAEVDPTQFRGRSAGGHIHIGSKNYSGLEAAIKSNPDRVVEFLDILCGNTCVLIDRDAGNRARRKLYGRAGEYRLPSHGIEYRTLSNFWLTAYPLMSLAFGMARFAVDMASSKDADKFYNLLTSKVSMEDVRKAINTNNFKLAYKNFKAIESIILEYAHGSDHTGLDKTVIKEFHHFVATVKDHGLSYWFKQDPMSHWMALEEAHAGGISDFLKNVVRKDMNKTKSP